MLDHAVEAFTSDGRRIEVFANVGGDKPLPYLDLGVEDIPFLGWRAIRVCLDMPAFFKTQLRAILRAAAAHIVKIMFPMIATREEFVAAKALLEESRLELVAEGAPAPDRIDTGVMIGEPVVPSCKHSIRGARRIRDFSPLAWLGRPRNLPG